MNLEDRTMSGNKKIIGVTFFSVLQGLSNKYVIHNKDYKDYVDDLFEEKRLDLKTEIFFKISLPSLQGMDKQGCSYSHYILYSKQLPEKYKMNIKESINKYSFLRGVEIDDYIDFDIKSILNEDIDKGEVFAYFGLDDDDLISIDYLQKIKDYVNKEFVGFNICLSKGFSGYYDGEVSNVRELRFPFINIGQARICNRENNGNIYIPNKGSHMRTDEKCPTVIDSTSPTFFWLRHHMQDTFSTADESEIKTKINRDLDEHDYPKSSILAKFPVLKEYMIPTNLFLKSTRKNILLNNRKAIEKIPLSMSPEKNIDGHLVIKYSLKNLDGISRRQALAVFELSESLSENEANLAGLTKSKVGYYRYFNTAGSNINGTFSLYLPEGVNLTSISLMKWADESILLDTIEVFEANNSTVNHL